MNSNYEKKKEHILKIKNVIGILSSFIAVQRYTMKTLILILAMTYGLCVSWLTAFTMTIVHDRVPDMNKENKTNVS